MAPATLFTFVCLLHVMVAKEMKIHEQWETLETRIIRLEHSVELLEEQVRQLSTALGGKKLNDSNQLVQDKPGNATTELNTEKEMEQRLVQDEPRNSTTELNTEKEMKQRLKASKQKKNEEKDMCLNMFKNAVIDKEETLLSLSKTGNTTGVQCSIDKGADLEAKGDMGKTALHFAAEAGHVGVVQVLVDSGADVNARDDYNSWPLMLAALNGRAEVCKVLIQGKTSVNLTNKRGETALFWAVYNGSIDVTAMLIAAGAQVNAVTKLARYSALNVAALRHNTEMCRLLLNSGAQVNQLDVAKRTPLHSAAENCDLETLKLLVQFHADPSLKDTRGETALNTAVKVECREAADYLRQVYINN